MELEDKYFWFQKNPCNACMFCHNMHFLRTFQKSIIYYFCTWLFSWRRQVEQSRGRRGLPAPLCTRGLQADVWENVAGGMFREWQFTHALWPQGLFPKIALFLGNPDNGRADFSALHSHLDTEIQLCHSLRNYLISSGLLKSPAKRRQNIPNIAVSVRKLNDYHYFEIQVLDTTLFII